MATLRVVGTGSKQGNSYLLNTSKGTLIIDLGCPWSDILKRLNYKIEDVDGCLVSHFHSDHSKSIQNALKYQLPVYSCKEVADKYHGVRVLEQGFKYRIGSFLVQPMHVEHNAENYAYIIDNDETGRILFVTDCMYFPYRIKGINHLLIEANWSEDIFLDHLCDNEEIRSNNQYHMEIEETVMCVKRLYSADMNTILLIHLSDGQSNGEAFKKRIYDAIGMMPSVADKGMTIELNKEEF